MKNRILAALLTAALCCTMIGSASAYTGVADYFTQEIQAADAAGVIPELLEDADLSQNITRREFCHVIVSAYDNRSSSSGSYYDDDDYYYPWFWFSAPKPAAKELPDYKLDALDVLLEIWDYDNDIKDFWFDEKEDMHWYYNDEYNSQLVFPAADYWFDEYGSLYLESDGILVYGVKPDFPDDPYGLERKQQNNKPSNSNNNNNNNNNQNNNSGSNQNNNQNNNKPDVNQKSEYFSDVNDPVIDRAHELGFVNGYEDGTFQPDKQITRQEMFKMMEELLDSTRWTNSLSLFTAMAFLNYYADGAQVADWAKPSTATLLYYGIVNGSNGLIDPLSPSSRAQAIVLAYRVLNNDLKDSDLPIPYPIISDMNFYFNSSGLVPAVDEYGWISYGDDWTDREDYIFDGGPRYASQAESSAHMVSVKVPVWKLNGDGTKTASSMTVTVHEKLEHIIWSVFNEIFNDPEQFPISDMGGYSWRGDTSRSEHKWGLALDLNVSANPQVIDFEVKVGTAWEPGINPYSFTEDCSVVRIFEKYGFTWGGNAWGEYNRDYMHFSYLGT